MDVFNDTALEFGRPYDFLLFIAVDGFMTRKVHNWNIGDEMLSYSVKYFDKRLSRTDSNKFKVRILYTENYHSSIFMK